MSNLLSDSDEMMNEMSTPNGGRGVGNFKSIIKLAATSIPAEGAEHKMHTFDNSAPIISVTLPVLRTFAIHKPQSQIQIFKNATKKKRTKNEEMKVYFRKNKDQY